MTVIQQAITMPILRPLVGMDKQEIVDQARRIGTFATSSIPDQDFCQLFVPKHPATKARLDEVAADEAKLDVNELVRYGLDNDKRRGIQLPTVNRTRNDDSPCRESRLTQRAVFQCCANPGTPSLPLLE